MMQQSSVFIVVGISCLFAVALAGSIPFKDCGSADAKVTSVFVSGCTTPPCPLKKGTNTTVTMIFTPTRNVTTATNKAYGYIGIIKTPYPLKDANACDFMKCPLVAGTSSNYTTNVFVQNSYPELSLLIEWQLHDGKDNSMITCFQIEGKIVA